MSCHVLTYTLAIGCFLDEALTLSHPPKKHTHTQIAQNVQHLQTRDQRQRASSIQKHFALRIAQHQRRSRITIYVRRLYRIARRNYCRAKSLDRTKIARHETEKYNKNLDKLVFHTEPARACSIESKRGAKLVRTSPTKPPPFWLATTDERKCST